LLARDPGGIRVVLPSVASVDFSVGGWGFVCRGVQQSSKRACWHCKYSVQRLGVRGSGFGFTSATNTRGPPRLGVDGPSTSPRDGHTVGSYEGVVSYERGTPANPPPEVQHIVNHGHVTRGSGVHNQPGSFSIHSTPYASHPSPYILLRRRRLSVPLRGTLKPKK